METADVRKKLQRTIEAAKRRAGERQARNDEATRAFDVCLTRLAVPLFRQVANILKSEGYAFTVFTPSGSVRLMSDRRPEDFLDLSLDSDGDSPQVVLRVSRNRGGRVLESEGALGGPDALTEEGLLESVTTALEPFVSK